MSKKSKALRRRGVGVKTHKFTIPKEMVYKMFVTRFDENGKAMRPEYLGLVTKPTLPELTEG